MVVRFKKKVKKMRGSSTHGWGAKKKHRGSGSRGGAGMAGGHKHKISLITSKFPDHFGYKGFHSHFKKDKIINLDEIDKMDNKSIIDLEELGFTKLLARGEITKAYKIKVSKYSAEAKEKIEKAGGSIVE